MGGPKLTFQNALFAAGIFLILFGIVFAAVNSQGPLGPGGLVESVSYGFSAAFFALFSGVLIGVGATLFICGLIVFVQGNKKHVLIAFGFSIVSALIAAAAVVQVSTSTFPMLVVFFAGLSSSGAFLVASILFAIPSLVRNYLNEHAEE